MAKKGYSREQFLGTGYNHYDSKGHKTGESRLNWAGGYTDYDAKGKKIGESRPNWAGGYTHYDTKGHKTGESRYSISGYNHYDAKGHKTGESNWSLSGYNHNDSTTESCYVATCVYGSYDCPEAWTLRRFRDETLGRSFFGRLFIRSYYAAAPIAVRWFGNSSWFRRFWKGRLDRLVDSLREKGVADTPYEDRNWRITR